MVRIKIQDLPKGMVISKEEMRKVMGGNPLFTSLTGSLGTPWVLAGTIAAPIAIPVAIGDRNERPSEN
ncbi:MAG: hypothetical protein V3V52_10505 [Candidatus Adiutricales bacterium]